MLLSPDLPVGRSRLGCGAAASAPKMQARSGGFGLNSHRQRGQRGQALLLVLIFVAAFLLLTWAGLTLAASSFLDLSSVQADTRTTVALDAGLAYGMEALDLKKGNGCNAPGLAGPLVLNYPSGAITVNITITKGAPCKGNGANFSFHVTSPSTGHTLDALVTQTGGVMVITWERFQ